MGARRSACREDEICELSEPVLVPAAFFPLWIVAVAVAFLLVFASTIAVIVNGWLNGNLLGFFIFGMSVFMIWAKRDRLKRTPLAPNLALGFLLTVLGCLMFIAGEVTCTSVVQNVSMALVFLGLVWLLAGNGFAKTLGIPVGYLVFMSGPLEELLAGVSIYFQYVSAWIAAGLLLLIRMPVVLSGTYIQMPHITLEVADVCSGVHHIVALVAMAIPLAYMTQRSWFGKATVVAAAFPVGILANGLRIALIGIWTDYARGASIHGPKDIFYAIFISFFGVILLVLLSGVVSRLHRRDMGPRALTAMTEDAVLSPSVKPVGPAGISVAILLMTFSISIFCNPTPVHLKTPLELFPVVVGAWVGKDENSLMLAYEQMHADAQLRRVYQDPVGNRIRLYIAFFAKQQAGKKVVDGNFTLPKGDVEIVSLAIMNKVVRIKKVVYRDMNKRKTLYYWYEVNGRILADPFETKLAHLVDVFVKKRTNASLIVVSVENEDKSKNGFTVGEEHQFIQLLLPISHTFLNNI